MRFRRAGTSLYRHWCGAPVSWYLARLPGRGAELYISAGSRNRVKSNKLSGRQVFLPKGGNNPLQLRGEDLRLPAAALLRQLLNRPLHGPHGPFPVVISAYGAPSACSGGRSFAPPLVCGGFHRHNIVDACLQALDVRTHPLVSHSAVRKALIETELLFKSASISALPTGTMGFHRRPGRHSELEILIRRWCAAPDCQNTAPAPGP